MLTICRNKQVGMNDGKGFSKSANQPNEVSLTICHFPLLCSADEGLKTGKWKMQLFAIPFQMGKEAVFNGSLYFLNGFSRKITVHFDSPAKIIGQVIIIG